MLYPVLLYSCHYKHEMITNHYAMHSIVKLSVAIATACSSAIIHYINNLFTSVSVTTHPKQHNEGSDVR